MLVIRAGRTIRPAHVDINLSVTYGKDFYVGECHGLRRKIIAESQYGIKTDTITLLYGDMMDFRIGFENGVEYRFQTLFDGRKTSGSISIDIGDLPKWNILLQNAEQERLAQEKANAPERIISTEEFQKTSLVFAQDACEKFYEEMLDIERDYERNAMTPNIFVDFSVYEQRWIDLHKRSKAKYDELADFDALWHKQPNRDFSATGLYGVMLNQTRSLYLQIYVYCDEMAQMMHHLYEKAQGRKYIIKDYQKELQRTEQRRSIIAYECPDVKKRYQDLMNNR